METGTSLVGCPFSLFETVSLNRFEALWGLSSISRISSGLSDSNVNAWRKSLKQKGNKRSTVANIHTGQSTANRRRSSFIDMTSHELRNPLSAMLQCAYLALTFLRQLSTEKLSKRPSDVDAVKKHAHISSSIESLQTIVSCSLHMKAIIDDVLTLSKLDSNLIVITPVRVQPSVVVKNALKMFEVECAQEKINLVYKEDESFKNMDWVLLDPSRLVQILINLLYVIFCSAKVLTHDTDLILEPTLSSSPKSAASHPSL